MSQYGGRKVNCSSNSLCGAIQRISRNQGRYFWFYFTETGASEKCKLKYWPGLHSEEIYIFFLELFVKKAFSSFWNFITAK